MITVVFSYGNDEKKNVSNFSTKQENQLTFRRNENPSFQVYLTIRIHSWNFDLQSQ